MDYRKIYGQMDALQFGSDGVWSALERGMRRGCQVIDYIIEMSWYKLLVHSIAHPVRIWNGPVNRDHYPTI